MGERLAAVDRSARFASAVDIAVTAVYRAGLLVRRERQVLRMGVDSLVALAAYAGALVVLYSLRGG